MLFTGTNVARNGDASQSSTKRSARRAIDGQTEDSCSSTDTENDPWWRVDLLDKHQIWSIKITNTEGNPKEGVNGAEIRIGDSLRNDGNDNPKCRTVESIELGSAATFDCAGMQGRFINIIRPGRKKHLTLCEVEVYGQPLFIIQAC
uniref:pentraxin fusion protein-like n=1 Tax=Pristiophorus japonicus TaxID=55135 RepID=UPI00398EC607